METAGETVNTNNGSGLAEALQRYGDLVQAERACHWAVGEVVAEAVKDLTKKDRRKAYGAFAEAGHCTIAHIEQHRAVYLAYTPAERMRCREMTWSLARAIMQAAKRAGEPVAFVLSVAMAENWHLPEATRYARRDKKKQLFALNETCGSCTARVQVKAPLRGLAMPCPVCIVTAWLDGGDGKELPRLGALC